MKWKIQSNGATVGWKTKQDNLLNIMAKQLSDPPDVKCLFFEGEVFRWELNLLMTRAEKEQTSIYCASTLNKTKAP